VQGYGIDKEWTNGHEGTVLKWRRRRKKSKEEGL
jgi:hypothetical protein